MDLEALLMNPETLTSSDIYNMSMAEYAQLREHLMTSIGIMTPQQIREAEEIPAPAPEPVRWTFKSF